MNKLHADVLLDALADHAGYHMGAWLLAAVLAMRLRLPEPVTCGDTLAWLHGRGLIVHRRAGHPPPGVDEYGARGTP